MCSGVAVDLLSPSILFGNFDKLLCFSKLLLMNIKEIFRCSEVCAVKASIAVRAVAKLYRACAYTIRQHLRVDILLHVCRILIVVGDLDVWLKRHDISVVIDEF